MGTYINPGNSGFKGILASGYVDKTGLIDFFNQTLGTMRKLVCITRPRRFGKSFAAESLVAYYSCGCDSRALFEGLEVSRSAGFEEHLNAYNVVQLDMSSFTGSGEMDVVEEVVDRLMDDMRRDFPGIPLHDALDLAFLDVVRATSRKFVFVIDEWDAPLREGKSEAAKERWVKFLRLLFKNANFTSEAVAGAYMTGILPIKRYGTQSALTDFWEYTMLDPAQYAPYVGFTEGEVEALASKHGLDAGELRHWYDGYSLPGIDHIYTPFSVMQACLRGRCAPYWTATDSFQMLKVYIDLDLDGLQQAIVQALGDGAVPVDTGGFDNDMSEVHSRDDALTLLAHLGYLAYDADARTVRVPNEEVRGELLRAIRGSSHAEVARIVRESDMLLRATWDLDEEAVAAGIQHAHEAGCAPVYYNDEQALRAIVKAAYISGLDQYALMEELPSGRGLADVVFLPKRGSAVPAMVVELKWSRAPEAAIAQIRDRDYPAALRDWRGPILLVGITYDPKTKEHSCIIEEA